jgi:Tfp pilus assembly protein PilX
MTHDDAIRRRTFRAPRRKTRGDEGASLILALIFIVVVSTIATAMTSWVTADLNNTAKFTGGQSIESAANSATETAIQSARYTFVQATINASPPQPCWTTSTPQGQIVVAEQNTSVTLSVFCSTVFDPLSTRTRTVTISTCIYSAAPSAAAACAASPLLQAVVILNDYPAVGAAQCNPYLPGPTTTVPDQTTCGTGMSVKSWAFAAALPTVTNVADASSPLCPLSELVTITGTGFSGTTAVNFMPGGGGDTILTGTNVNVGTTVTACASTKMTPGAQYQVTVTTPAGTSATNGANSLLTY